MNLHSNLFKFRNNSSVTCQANYGLKVLALRGSIPYALMILFDLPVDTSEQDFQQFEFFAPSFTLTKQITDQLSGIEKEYGVIRLVCDQFKEDLVTKDISIKALYDEKLRSKPGAHKSAQDGSLHDVLTVCDYWMNQKFPSHKCSKQKIPIRTKVCIPEVICSQDEVFKSDVVIPTGKDFNERDDKTKSFSKTLQISYDESAFSEQIDTCIVKVKVKTDESEQSSSAEKLTETHTIFQDIVQKMSQIEIKKTGIAATNLLEYMQQDIDVYEYELNEESKDIFDLSAFSHSAMKFDQTIYQKMQGGFPGFAARAKLTFASFYLVDGLRLLKEIVKMETVNSGVGYMFTQVVQYLAAKNQAKLFSYISVDNQDLMQYHQEHIKLIQETLAVFTDAETERDNIVREAADMLKHEIPVIVDCYERMLPFSIPDLQNYVDYTRMDCLMDYMKQTGNNIISCNVYLPNLYYFKNYTCEVPLIRNVWNFCTYFDTLNKIGETYTIALLTASLEFMMVQQAQYVERTKGNDKFGPVNKFWRFEKWCRENDLELWTIIKPLFPIVTEFQNHQVVFIKGLKK